MTDIVGTNDPDVLNGTSGSDQISGLAGDDTLSGDSGDDTVNGGDGDDWLSGDLGNDQLFGGLGDDVLVALRFFNASGQMGDGDDLYDGGDGNDTVYLAPFPNGVTVNLATGIGTGNGNDRFVSVENLWGTNFADILTGGAGSNWFYGGAGDDTLSGGAGDDILDGGIGNNIVDGGDGHDQIIAQVDIATVVSNVLRGGAGQDLIHVRGAGAIGATPLFEIFAGDGDDVVRYEDRNVAGMLSVDLGAGDDELRIDTVQSGGAFITTGAGRDLINFSNAFSAFNRGEVRITDFTAGVGGDRLELTGLFARTLQGWDVPGQARLNPFTSGYARLVQDGADTVLQVDRDGGDNSYVPFIRFENMMAGALEATNLDWYGLTGNDFPALSWVGTSGDDVLNSGVTGVMNASGMGGNDRIILSDGDDFGRGGDGDDVIFGGFGNDWLEGNLGNDELHGGEGSDLFVGTAGLGGTDGTGGGVDRFYGGIGGDSYIVDTQAHLIFENAGEGYDTVRSSVSYYLYDNVEVLQLIGSDDIFGVGNALDNSISGGAGSNLLLGGLGDDEIRGFAGNDLLFGEGGSDTIYGGDGIDYLVGGAGRDLLNGEEGADAIYGGTGNDYLLGGSGFFTDILVGGDGDDTLDGGMSTGLLPQLGDYDLMDGGFGNDSYYVDTPADLTFEAAGQGTDTVYADIVGAGYYLYPHVENLVLLGATPFGVGNDLNNNLSGNAVGNYLLGGAGNDFINGGNGNDVLFGEAGNDTFVFNRGTGTDVIGDFTRGQDRIILSEYGLSFAQLQARFVQVGNDGAIQLPNGDTIILHNIVMSQLTAADILAAPSTEASPKTDADVMDVAHGFVADEDAAGLFADDVFLDDSGLQRWGMIRPEFELV